ncbi:MAG: hypothetical protein IKM04_08290 [Clostridia bacterium]|nr:hypothetical protein [Clostridia bacterium]
MKRRKLFQSLLPIVLLIAMLASCGGREEVPWQKTATYTAATGSTTVPATTVATTPENTTVGTSSSHATTEASTAEPWPEYVNGEVTPFEELTDDYWPNQAEKENCVIHRDGDVSSGQDVWERFVELTWGGTPVSVRIVDYYSNSTFGGDAAYITDIIYDGEIYTTVYAEKGIVYEKYYDYLMKYDMPSYHPSASFETAVWYVLTCDNTLTWQKVEAGLDQYGFPLKMNTVYRDYVYKVKPTQETLASYACVNGSDEITLEDAYELLLSGDIQLSADMGYVTHDESDIYAGREKWDEFVRLVEQGEPCAVRGTKFYPNDLYVYDVVYDGKIFWYRAINKHLTKKVYSSYEYLTYIEDVPSSENADYEKVYVYILTRIEPTSYIEQFKEPKFFGEFPWYEDPFCDYIYKEE